MIASIRKSDPSVLLLDGGAAFGGSRDVAQLQVKAMEAMGYDALNLGGPEFNFGREFLEHARSAVSFPYIASNLLYGGSRLPWTREYVIKETGGIKIAILGVSDPDDFGQPPDREQVKGLEVIPPETALRRLLPEVGEKVDLVILLSQLDVEKTRALVNAVKGIDVAISSGNDNVFYAAMPENTVLLQTGSQGKTLGLLKISLDEKGLLRVDENRYLPLLSSVPDDAKVARLVEEFKETQKQKAAELARKRYEMTYQGLMEGLQLSPQEFMERYGIEQTEKKKGEPR